MFMKLTTGRPDRH